MPPPDPDALYREGAALYAGGDLAAAEARLKQAIGADARTAAFHAALGNVLQDRGALDEAIRAYRRALRLKPDLAEAHNDLGTAHFAKGDAARALACYRRAAALRPGHAVAWANLGAVYRKLGMPREARQALQKELAARIRNFFRFSRRVSPSEEELEKGNARLALQLLGEAPGDARAQAVRALAQYRTGIETEEVMAGLERGLRLRPPLRGAARAAAELALARGEWPRAEACARQARLDFELGEALFRQGRAPEAEQALRAALAADPGEARAWIRLGELLRLGRRLEEAEACLAQALALDEESVAALVAAGLVLREKGLTDAAIARFEQALALEPQSAQALQQVGEILRYENRIEEAERRFRQGLKARPGDPALTIDLAMVLGDQMRYDEAFGAIEQVLARDRASPLALAAKGVLLDLTGHAAEAEALLAGALEAAPGNVDLGYNLAICRLRHGKLAQGWKGFELRRLKDTFVGRYRKFPFPEWQGEPLEGKAILVYPEQGLGDEIMYASCLGELASRAGHVALECDPRLGELFRRSFPACTVMPRLRTMANDWVNHLEPRPELQVPIGSLAGRLRSRAEDFPQHQGFLKADPLKVEQWRIRLARLGPGKKIGLSWQGGVGHTGRARRSLTLEQLLPVLRTPGAHFVSLQYTGVAAEIEALRAKRGVTVHHWREAIDDYDETAALVCALDSVLTVCTAIVHLTGALGRPALVMVPFGSDWRYGAEGERMPWYPSVRLVRQRAIGDWSGVLAAVGERLA